MNERAREGRLFGVGVGPGDPELITLKAARVIREAQVVTYLAARRSTLSNARSIAAALIGPEHIELPLIYPYGRPKFSTARKDTKKRCARSTTNRRNASRRIWNKDETPRCSARAIRFFTDRICTCTIASRIASRRK